MKKRVQSGDGLPVNPRHSAAWGTILGESPSRALPLGEWSLDTGGRRLLGVKDLVFVGTSDDDLRDLPQVARQRVGYQLDLAARGQDPTESTATDEVGTGCRQLQVHEAGDVYRVSYVSSIGDTVYVLRCSQEQGPQTAVSDLDLGNRYEQMSALIEQGSSRDVQAL